MSTAIGVLLALVALGADGPEQGARGAATREVKPALVLLNDLDIKIDVRVLFETTLDTDALKTLIELRLRQAGVEANPSSRNRLQLTFIGMDSPFADAPTAVGYAVSLELMMPVKIVEVPDRNRTLVAPVWRELAIGTAREGVVTRALRGGAENLVTAFVDDVVAANPLRR